MRVAAPHEVQYRLDREPFVIGAVRVIRVTLRGVLVQTDNPSIPPITLWIPKSQIHGDSTVQLKTRATGVLCVHAWLVKERGWYDKAEIYEETTNTKA